MKKIIVDKSEGITEVIDKMLSVEDSDITLVIPKGSVLAKSGSNFRLLKREADAAEKNIGVESVDETILDFAKENRIPSGHAFLKNGGGNDGQRGIDRLRSQHQRKQEEKDGNGGLHRIAVSLM